MKFIYGKNFTKDAWLSPLVPCNNTDKFYGPNVHNIKIFIDLDSLNYYSAEDILTHPHALRLIDTYKNFYKYKTTIIIDTVELDEEEENFIEFEEQIKTICNKLKDYGFSYYGRVNSSEIDVNQFLINLLS